MDKTQIYASIIAVVGIIASIIILFFALSIQNAVSNFSKNAREYINNYENLKAEMEKQLLEVEIESQENTFQFISKEIHDNISQNLSLAVINLNCLKLPTPFIDDQKLIVSVNQIKKSIEDLNNLSKSLDSDLIESHGLVTACKFECERWNRLFNIEVEFQLIGESIHLNKTIELFLLRILQESLSNAIKYSKANSIKCILTYENDQVSLVVQDNGVGFDLKDVVETKIAGKRSGIKNMKQRALMLKGNIEIKTGPMNGTKITVTINNPNHEKKYNWASR